MSSHVLTNGSQTVFQLQVLLAYFAFFAVSFLNRSFLSCEIVPFMCKSMLSGDSVDVAWPQQGMTMLFLKHQIIKSMSQCNLDTNSKECGDSCECDKHEPGFVFAFKTIG